MDLICQKMDLNYAEALNSILPKQSITDLFVGKIRQQDQGLITSLSLNLTVV